MTAQEREDGMRQEPGLSAAEKADGFAAVMKRLKSHSPDERARLRTQAEEVALGHEAYALGQEYLDRGNYEAARRWLRVAAGHHIPGAAQALEEIALQQTLDGFADLAAFGGDQTAADAAPCGTIPSPPAMRAVDGNHRFKQDQAWASVMEGLYSGMAAAAREQAGRITAQARREADAILAEARQQAERTAAACAEIVLDTEQDRREATQLLAEARQQAEGVEAACAEIVLKAKQHRRKAAEFLAEARSVRSEVLEVAERARRGAREMLAKAAEEALLIIDGAREEAAQIRGRARPRAGGPNREGIQLGWELLTPAGYPVDGVSRNAVDRSARGLPGPTLPGRRALERLPQVPRSGTVMLSLECETDSGIRRWMRVPQERDGQEGCGPISLSGIRQVLGVVAACDVVATTFGSTNFRVDAADKLMMCTDGMVEMRGSDLSDGLAALCESAVYPTALITTFTEAPRRGRLRMLAIGVMKTDGDSDDDAELVAEVGNPAGR
ncbi:hypothetical protein [Streptomyces echinatus]|uniref:hypothetical protein n=1 Tax=Streptomyces echinatus TaxID=67293 RepID=UPI00382E522B